MKDSRRQRGQSLVEFALIGPIFLVVVLATIEAGLLLNAQVTLDNATREAARIGALCGNVKGNWEGFPGNPAAAQSPCALAMRQTLTANLGILPAIGIKPVSPSFATPADSANASCQPFSGPYSGAQQGCPLTITVSYQYTYLLGFVIGPSAPSTTLSSTATLVSQQ